MLKLLKYLGWKNWLLIGVSVGFVVLEVWLDLLMPDYTAKLTSAVAGGTVTMNDVWVNGGYMLLCALGVMAATIICSFITARVAVGFSYTIREKLFDRVMSFSDAERDKFSTASLITRETNDIHRISMFMSIGLQMLFRAPITAIWAITKISKTSVEWTMATVICVAVMIVVVAIVIGICLPKFKKVQKLLDNLNNATRDNVTGVRVVRAFNAEEYQEAKFEKANKDLTKNQLITAKTTGILLPLLSLCMSGLSLSIYWIGAYLMKNQTVMERVETIGNMTSFTQYALNVVMAFVMLVVVFIILPRSIVSAKRINEVLDTKLSIKNGNITEGKKGKKGEVEFKKVSFKYPDGQNYVISNLSFKVKKGETVAIIGATGSGKSTIINLLTRAGDVNEGKILVDGVDVKDYDFDTLQNKISIASQKAVLFKGTIKDNVTYGSNNPDDEERLYESLKIAQATFIDKLKDGVNSPVAQMGTNFSGGQKQRLSIARAVYKNAEIMVFDDSFSALDYKTDMLLRKALYEKFNDRTILIVAQRIGSIRHADKILVLDDGKLVGEGKHGELLKTCPLYKEIALSQLSKEEL